MSIPLMVEFLSLYNGFVCFIVKQSSNIYYWNGIGRRISIKQTSRFMAKYISSNTRSNKIKSAKKCY